MIANAESRKLIDDLAEKHLGAQKSQAHWTVVWKLFSDDPWFNRRLNDSAAYAIKRYRLPIQNVEDVQQEALIQFARSIQRDVTLGFRPERGEFGAFVATIINRCCQKGLRQFRHTCRIPITDESQHPLFENWQQIDEHIDLQANMIRIPEPYQSTIRLVCEGLTITEIAKKRRKSERTVYRWLEKGTELLREICVN